MNRILKNKKALSTVVASLILLVVSVLLAGVASYFALNVAGSRVQQEKLYLANVAVWYKNSTDALGALLVTNTGETDIVLSKVTIKGQESPWNGTSTFVLYTKIEGILTAKMEYVENFNQTGSNSLNLEGTDYDFTVVSENLILQSGWTMLFFIVNPGNLIVYDVVTPARVTISTGQALYATETIVKAVNAELPEGLKIRACDTGSLRSEGQPKKRFHYTVTLRDGAFSEEKLQGFLKQDTWHFSKKNRKGRTRTIDLKSLTKKISLSSKNKAVQISRQS